MKNPLVVFTGAALITLAALAGLKVTDWTSDAPPASNAAQTQSEAPKTAEAEKPAEKPAEMAAVQPTEQPQAETPKTETPAPEAAAAPAKPELDTVRVEADGQAIVAGRAQPGAEVSLKLGNEVLGKGVANSDGAWVVAPENPLPKGAHEITVEQKAADGATTTAEKSIAVAVPEKPGQQAMVALTEPGSATKVLQAGGATEPQAQTEKPAEPEQKTAAAEPAAPTEQAPAASAPAAGTEQPAAGETVQKTAEAPATGETVQKTAEAPATPATPSKPEDSTSAAPAEPATQEMAAVAPKAAEETQVEKPAEPAAPKATETPAKTADIPLRLDAVDYNDKGDIIFSGRAKPGTAVRLYVDNGSVGDAIVDSQGNWTFAGSDIIAPGTHSLRADQIDSSGKVMARIELPFQREDAAAVAALNAPAEPEPAPPAKSTEIPPPAQPETTTAQPVPQPSEPVQPEAQPAPQTTEVAKAEPETTTPAPSAPAASSETPATPEPQPEATEQAAAAPTTTEPETKQPEPDKPRSGKVVIQPGNNLWKLSRVIYGRGINFTVIYDANKEQIRDPDLIYPGQIFAIPNANPPESIDPKRRDPLTSAEGGTAQ
jgi:nucleoid-associated protein YgaU